MAKIIILNGPPRCGKDEAANAIEQYFTEEVCKHVKFSQPLKDIAQSIMGVDCSLLEKQKDTHISAFGTTYRDAQIHTYMQLCPVYGEGWLGHHLANRLKNYDQFFFVASDGGRDADLRAMLQLFSTKDIMIVQIMREGCSFTGDIRSYISSSHVRIKPIVNNNLEVYKSEMIEIASDFFAN